MEARATDAIFILYAEHEDNASAFAATVTASTLADMCGAITTGIGTLRGPLHGGATEAVLDLMMEVGDPSRAEQVIKDKLARRRGLWDLAIECIRSMIPGRGS